LPEGFYTFRVQAMEAGTGRQVSNIAETYFSITTPLPPVINLPFNGAEVMTAGAPGTEPQRGGAPPVSIQWMPRHYKQAGSTTTYDLKVCKVPNGFEPQEALDACLNPIIDDKANPGTFYPGNTGIGNSIIGAFERGVRYAVRVTVHEFDINGDEVAFANEGRSEVTWFTYGTPCVSPESFTIRETGPGRLQLLWPAAAGSKSYRVLYRREGESQWTTQAVTGTSTGLADLKPGRHEIAVQSECTDVIPANLQIFSFEEDQTDNTNLPRIARVNGFSVDSLTALLDSLSIPCASQINTYESCEADHPQVSPSGSSSAATEPLIALNSGEILAIYDMAVIVTESNGTSPFSGKGLARLPYMQNTVTPVEFSDVLAWKGQAGTRGGCVYKVGGYFRSYGITSEVIPENPDAPDNDTTRATIQYVVVNPIESNTATISWRDDKYFAKYTVKYKMASGGELQQDVVNPKMILVNLREGKNYTFTIDAYGTNGKLLDSYGPSH
jgi:hypothetical protein